MYNQADTLKVRIPALKTLLANDARWAVRGLQAIYKFQTAEEKDVEGVLNHNGVGFTSADGGFLSSLAEQSHRRELSERQMARLLKMMPKYARQLDRIVNKKQ